MRIAVDAFGGDNAPAAVVEGCIDALKKYPDMSVTLCGDEKRIKAELEKYRYDFVHKLLLCVMNVDRLDAVGSVYSYSIEEADWLVRLKCSAEGSSTTS